MESCFEELSKAISEEFEDTTIGGDGEQKLEKDGVMNRAVST